MKLTIKNIDKIFGRQLYSKWIPGTYGWAVGSVEDKNEFYSFELVSNGSFKLIEVKLRKEPIKYDPSHNEFLYELWAWNIINSNWQKEYYTKQDLDTIEGMVMRLGFMLEKIIPRYDEEELPPF